MAVPSSPTFTAFLAGTVVPLEQVPDPVFAGRMMGDGLAIEPPADAPQTLRAPCAGTIVQLHASHHACFLQTEAGTRLLLHIGIDTVLLKGEGFTPRVTVGDWVEAGAPLIDFDPAVLARRGKPAITVLAIENSDEHPIAWRCPAGPVVLGAPLLTLGAAAPAAAPMASAAEDEQALGWATVRHAGGLHARPCALLATAIKPYPAQLELVARGRSANARSATAVMGLAIGEGEEVEIRARGARAGDALEAAVNALQTPSAAHRPEPLRAAPVPATPSDVRPGELAGVPASPGLAVGPVAHLAHVQGAIPEAGEGEILERRALDAALQAVRADIDAAVADAEQRGLGEQAEVFAAHRVLCDDPELLLAATAQLSASKSAAFAWHHAIDAQCAALQATGNALLIGRINDLRDIERQALRRLLPQTESVALPPAGAVLVADDLLPSDFRLLERAGVVALLTAQGGPTSHVAILARARGLPAIVALGPQLAALKAGDTVVVDAERGRIDPAPGPERLAEVRARIAERETRNAEARAAAQAPAHTLDGTAIEVVANISTAEDARAAVDYGADGVGLLRTELLFLERENAPTVAEQQHAYQAVAEALAGRSAIFRTLDVGADKSLAYIALPKEENPALGLRGIRLGLLRESLLVEQLQAILALVPEHAVSIMIPMVSERDEILTVRALIDRLAATSGVAAAARPRLGIMIETPAAAVLADQYAEVADFFSIGTNDLTQYALCMDRTNPALAARIDAFHPAVLRLIDQAARGAATHARPVGVCGAMASDPLAVPLLLGLGVSELSVSPAVIPEIKAAVRRLDLAECRRIARTALEHRDAEATRALLRATWPWLGQA